MRAVLLLVALLMPALFACTPIQPVTAGPSANTTSPATDTTAITGTAAITNSAAVTTTAATLPDTPKAALAFLLSAPAVSADWFAPAVLNQVSIEQLDQVISDVKSSLGEFQRIEGESSPFTAVFSLGTVPAEITLDANGQIIGLFFHPPTLNVASLDDALNRISELPGEVNLLVMKNGEEVASLQPDQPLAVGSAFKLAVLLALRQQIEAGEHNWDEIVRLQPAWKTLPTGMLQKWPDDSPLTIHTLATLMISISDNTAADTLHALVGDEALEALSTYNHPFLTVQQLTKLKATQNADLLARYMQGDEAAQRQVLTELDNMPPPTVADLSPTPSPAVEWHFTPQELCELMAQVQDLDVMSVEPGPGVAQPQRWSHVAFKGGSEMGVLNLTTWLETNAGDQYCVTMTENRTDEAVDETQFVSLYRALIAVME